MSDPAVLALLERIADAVDAMRAELRRSARTRSAAALEAALRDRFAIGDEITTANLLRIADSDPHDPIAAALAGLVDLGADRKGRSVAVGALLASLDCLDYVREHRGSACYTLRI